MDVPAIFKRKAVELAEKLQERFPAKLMFVVPAVQGCDEDELFEAYRENVHVPHGQRVLARDETFFLTSEDIQDPMQMIPMLRSLWGGLGDQDKEAIWRYLEMFEKLMARGSRA